MEKVESRQKVGQVNSPSNSPATDRPSQSESVWHYWQEEGLQGPNIHIFKIQFVTPGLLVWPQRGARFRKGAFHQVCQQFLWILLLGGRLQVS